MSNGWKTSDGFEGLWFAKTSTGVTSDKYKNFTLSAPSANVIQLYVIVI